VISMMITVTLVTALAFAGPDRAPRGVCVAFAGPDRRTRGAGVRMAASAADLHGVQAACLEKVQAAFTLTERDFPNSLECAAWSSGPSSGAVRGFAAEPKLGWISSSITNSGRGVCASELTAFVAPAFDIPHLYQVVGLTPEGKISLTLDYIARYDLPADQNYLQDYFLSTTEWQEKLRTSVAGVAESAVRQDVYMRTIRSPMQLCLELENTADSLAALKAACESNVDRWIGWWQTAKEVNRMKVGSIFMRDTKIHRMRFQSHAGLLKASGVPAELAERVAQAIVGPGDEQYVGLGDGA